jgi:hypothetical protein
MLKFSELRFTDNFLDIEDMLKTIAFLRGHKWTTMQIKRVYFGNWLRDYSQARDNPTSITIILLT